MLSSFQNLAFFSERRTGQAGSAVFRGRQAGERRCSRSIWRTDFVWQWDILPVTSCLWGCWCTVGDEQSLRITFKGEEVKEKVEQIQRVKDELVLVPKDAWWEEAKSRCLEETNKFLSMAWVKENWSMKLDQADHNHYRYWFQFISTHIRSHSYTLL